MLAAGETDRARESLEIVLQADPGHIGARCRLAEITLFTDPSAARAYLEPVAGDAEIEERVADLLRLARQATLVDPKLLTSVEGHEPKPKWVELYLKANRALAEQDFAAALRDWIEVLTFDRDLDDDGARKACIALFHYLGEDHPLTREFSSAFSSALF
jgi:putative thioredoxin